MVTCLWMLGSWGAVSRRRARISGCEPFGVASLGETFGSVHVVDDSGDGYTERRQVEESLCRFAPRVAMVQTTQARR
jgi:hypothetical protein